MDTSFTSHSNSACMPGWTRARKTRTSIDLPPFFVQVACVLDRFLRGEHGLSDLFTAEHRTLDTAGRGVLTSEK